ncbi:MAG: hypothetical protein QF672_08285 [SAR202 cluster bacterium]|jgi:hypothetical protein|nr:hypothetical protein [SAR202 cluster bacterium]|tara:strand:+ start:3689 stop:3862 length:174 start_codon:yes stop_codon:yes gene_type:complete
MTFMLVWFMSLHEKLLNRFIKAHELMAQAIFRWLERTDPEEVRRLSKELDRLNDEDR